MTAVNQAGWTGAAQRMHWDGLENVGYSGRNRRWCGRRNPSSKATKSSAGVGSFTAEHTSVCFTWCIIEFCDLGNGNAFFWSVTRVSSIRSAVWFHFAKVSHIQKPE